MSAFAAVSKTPTATISGSSRGDARGTVRVETSTSTSALTAPSAGGGGRPGGALLGRLAEPDDEQPEAECRDSASPTPAATGRRAPPPVRGASGLARDEHDPGQRERDPDPLQRRRARCRAPGRRERDDRRGGRDRRHDPHRADRHPTVEAPEADHAGEPARQGEPQPGAGPCRPARHDPHREPCEAHEL